MPWVRYLRVIFKLTLTIIHITKAINAQWSIDNSAKAINLFRLTQAKVVLKSFKKINRENCTQKQSRFAEIFFLPFQAHKWGDLFPSIWLIFILFYSSLFLPFLLSLSCLEFKLFSMNWKIQYKLVDDGNLKKLIRRSCLKKCFNVKFSIAIFIHRHGNWFDLNSLRKKWIYSPVNCK